MKCSGANNYEHMRGFLSITVLVTQVLSDVESEFIELRKKNPTSNKKTLRGGIHIYIIHHSHIESTNG